ncbi:response regulator [Sulfitobacter dubius]|uniref:response regulator n=1 Tax=Sulfitobacter dubius TaxID=218673 RepID=UPI0008F2D3EB|nr:response regulator [Sulfitobacter dubius]SFH34847.1 Response regulator receiver domain-containing protein [Sulfitobacter dubius]
MKILAVDDNQFIREFLPAILKDTDFSNVTVAASGKEALAIIEATTQPFDCLLLDIVMPFMDGITLCRKIRAISSYRTTPIIMLTLKSDAISIEKAFAAGANDYIVKPFEVREVERRLRVIQRLLDSSEVALRLDPKSMLSGGTLGLHDFELKEPVHVLGVPQLVPPFSLGNYLSQLSRKHLQICQVFCAQIEDVEALYTYANSREYAMAIGNVAAAISTVVDCPQLLMAHFGGGTILSIVTGDSLPDWPQIEELVLADLQIMGPWGEEADKAPITVSIGRPVRPNANRTQRVRNTFNRAVDRAAGRQNSKNNLWTPHTSAVSSAR